MHMLRCNSSVGLAVLLGCAVIQGCTGSGALRVDVLSQQGSVHPPREEPIPVVVGVRVGLIDGEVYSADRDVMVSNLVAKLSEANMFEKVAFPAPDDAAFHLYVGAKTRYYRDSGVALAGRIVLCVLSLGLLCQPGPSEYEYRVEVRAVKGPTDEAVGRYVGVGRSRVTFSVSNRDDADRAGWQKAATSAHDELIGHMRADEAKFLPGAGP
jgi:hypothetical protein